MKNVVTLITIIMVLLFVSGCNNEPEVTTSAVPCTTIKVGHVGHDHHLALFVAADNAAEYSKISGIELKTVKHAKFYELWDQGNKVADVEIVKVGGGSKMPTALAQNIIEIGFGGVAAVLAAVDSGAPVKIISPLHYKGDMFVVKPDFPIDSWDEFVKLARNSERPIRIGYKNPVAVAKVVFEEALQHERITFGGDLSRKNLQVHLINVKGGGKLNVALGGDLIDGYVGNNPFPSLAIEKELGKIICDLEELPPGTFRDHPCCCIGANAKAMNQKADAIVDLLVLFLQANETINTDIDKAVASAVRWLGTSESVERMSIATSGYSLEASDKWNTTMTRWIEAMNGLGIFKDKLKGVESAAALGIACDLTLLAKAKEKFAKRKNNE